MDSHKRPLFLLILFTIMLFPEVAVYAFLRLHIDNCLLSENYLLNES